MKAIRVEKEDDVAVAAQNIPKGTSVDCSGLVVVARQDIPTGHKIALREIEEGSLVLKFGVPIGRASATIPPGSHVHVHNLEDITEELCNAYEEKFRAAGV